MSRVHPSFLTLTAASLAFLATACSDTTSPTSSLRAGSAAFAIGPTANVGAVQVTFGSGTTTQFCASATQIHVYNPVPGTVTAPIAGCAAASSLQANITNVYNPGWSPNLAGSEWIGPNATANEYRTAPGTYVFQTALGSIPATATNIVLNDTLLSDNAVAVYINGVKLEQQVIQDCPLGGPCNWNQTFVISDAVQAHFNRGVGSVNTLTVLLVDTPNGGTEANGYQCLLDPQPNGWTGFTFDVAHQVATSPGHIVAGWTKTMTTTTGCENPTGLDFHGSVSWVVPTPPPTTTWCSPGYWKTHNSNPPWPVTAALVPYQNLLYNSFSALYAHGPTVFDAAHPAKYSKGGVDNPTLYQVISNPPAYGGEATNNVADIISNKVFGTPIGSGVENCPLN